MELLEDIHAQKQSSYERGSGRQRAMRSYLGASSTEYLEQAEPNWFQRSWRFFWHSRGSEDWERVTVIKSP